MGGEQFGERPAQPAFGGFPGDLGEAIRDIDQAQRGVDLPQPVRGGLGDVAEAPLADGQFAAAGQQVIVLGIQLAHRDQRLAKQPDQPQQQDQHPTAEQRQGLLHQPQPRTRWAPGQLIAGTRQLPAGAAAGAVGADAQRRQVVGFAHGRQPRRTEHIDEDQYRGRRILGANAGLVARGDGGGGHQRRHPGHGQHAGHAAGAGVGAARRGQQAGDVALQPRGSGIGELAVEQAIAGPILTVEHQHSLVAIDLEQGLAQIALFEGPVAVQCLVQAAIGFVPFAVVDQVAGDLFVEAREGAANGALGMLGDGGILAHGIVDQQIATQADETQEQHAERGEQPQENGMAPSARRRATRRWGCWHAWTLAG